MDYLKESNKRYEPRKSESLSVDDVKRFLTDALDEEYLAAKVALIIVLFRGCRLCDLLKLSAKDVEERGEIIKITLKNRKNNSNLYYRRRNASTNHRLYSIASRT